MTPLQEVRKANQIQHLCMKINIVESIFISVAFSFTFCACGFRFYFTICQPIHYIRLACLLMRAVYLTNMLIKNNIFTLPTTENINCITFNVQ